MAMSVYTELVKIGLTDSVATEIAEAVRKSEQIVTVEILDARLSVNVAHLDQRLAEMETRMVRTILTSMIALTGIYAFFVAVMTWVVKQ
jgi:hypothetical protein